MLPDLPIPPLTTLVELERVALHVATEAALLIVDRSAATVAATKSSPTDVVTEMDRRSQELIQTLLRAERPQDGFFGEEDGRAAGTSEITWVVDPIDGTVNYVYDIPAYAVSVAAVVGDPQTPGAWRPVAGAVVNPVTGERFWARAGGGAWRQRGRFDPIAVHASGQADPAASLVATGFSYDADTRAWQGGGGRAGGGGGPGHPARRQRRARPVPCRRRHPRRLLRTRSQPVGFRGGLADRRRGRRSGRRALRAGSRPAHDHCCRSGIRRPVRAGAPGARGGRPGLGRRLRNLRVTLALK
ncbi:putative Inositol-phosphate phosphatase [Nostocoides australiense Ben110]|uniref:Putative Inositol-phosphate phosphatase n=1 Tax=Nostocoides australiense Ben110 TaxID=1193182 RepID=W6K3W4_9MICO|nr:putative Inositol-phosphate phosphatase [Tetrasphaera australiensis Ben110]